MFCVLVVPASRFLRPKAVPAAALTALLPAHRAAGYAAQRGSTALSQALSSATRSRGCLQAQSTWMRQQRNLFREKRVTAYMSMLHVCISTCSGRQTRQRQRHQPASQPSGSRPARRTDSQARTGLRGAAAAPSSVGPSLVSLQQPQRVRYQPCSRVRSRGSAVFAAAKRIRTRREDGPSRRAFVRRGWLRWLRTDRYRDAPHADNLA